MLFKKEVNPVFELQKDLEKERILLGRIDETGKLETDDKMMYNLIEKIFDKGKKYYKKNNLISKIIWAACGFLGGSIFVTILSLLKIIKF